MLIDCNYVTNFWRVTLDMANCQPDNEVFRWSYLKTSHAPVVSSGGVDCCGGAGERGRLVVALAGVQAVIGVPMGRLKKVASGGGVAVAGGSPAVVVGAGAA